MAKVIEATFNDNIKCGPEYVCTRCDKLCHLSESVKQTNILNVPKRCLKHV